MTDRRRELLLPIRTPRLVLRAYLASDVDASLAYYSDPTVVRYVPWRPWTRAQTEERVAARMHRTRLAAPGSVVSLAVQHEGRLIGDVALWPADETMSRGEMGWALHPSVHGRGFGLEAVRAVVDLAFHTFGMHRVVARVDPRNSASVRLCERVGMTREAHLRQDSWIKDEWVDTVVFGLLASDPTPEGAWTPWPSVR